MKCRFESDRRYQNSVRLRPSPGGPAPAQELEDGAGGMAEGGQESRRRIQIPSDELMMLAGPRAEPARPAQTRTRATIGFRSWSIRDSSTFGGAQAAGQQARIPRHAGKTDNVSDKITHPAVRSRVPLTANGSVWEPFPASPHP